MKPIHQPSSRTGALPDRHQLIALNAARGLGRASLCRLAAEPDWSNEALPRSPAAISEEARRLGVPAAQLERAHRAIADASAADRERERAHRRGATILTLGQVLYPPGLHDLELPPPVLYIEGDPAVLTVVPAVAIVGSRRASRYGRRVADHFSQALAAVGAVVVSGFARGIDATAHQGALAAAGGRTVAVLGCGLDIDYPRGHRELRQEIAGKGGTPGALVSEFPWGQEPRPWSFPVRNRVIAALAGLTLVVEATHRSGSLITAHHALELGREVFAVPGSIFDRSSQGTLALVRDGAGLARKPQDLIEALGFSSGTQGSLWPSAGPLEETPVGSAKEGALPAAPKPRPKGPEAKLLGHLPAGQALSTEDLAAASGRPVELLLADLLELELGGWIRRLPGPLYLRCGS